MKNLNISISDVEFRKFGLKKEKLTFSDLVEIISNELMKQSLEKSIELAEKSGLSKMTMSEISKEVKAVRRNAKNNH